MSTSDLAEACRLLAALFDFVEGQDHVSDYEVYTKLAERVRTFLARV